MADDNENDISNENGTDTSSLFKKSGSLPPYDINRKVLFQENVNDLSLYEKPNKNYVDNIRHSIAKFSFVQFILNLIPVLKWLPKYSFKNNIAGDLTAGMTVAVMHIPQGMAYGLLAGVTPSSGLYMAFFPTLTYFVFGTSRHISVGTLSVISLMTLKVVQTHATIGPVLHSATDNATLTDAKETYTPIQVVTAVAFMCGMQQILMSALQLGHLATLLSEPLVNGFTTGAAVHVLVSQLKDLFGVKIPSHKGAFKIIYTVIDCIKSLPRSNPYTIAISLSIIVFMVLMNEVIKPRAAKLFKFPVPAELIAVVAGTAASFLFRFEEEFNVKLVGAIPIGLPPPTMPPINLLWLVAVDAIAISIVSYSVTISMAMIFAKKQSYEVKANQEMLALGFSNIIGGLFSCVPNGTSLSRSLIQEQTGEFSDELRNSRAGSRDSRAGSARPSPYLATALRTQIASVVSAGLILIVLLWIGPVFEVLPRCVLSGIIVVALKGMYIQAAALPRFYREGKLEAISWIVTFIAVVLVDVDIGLVMGICVSIIALYIKGWKMNSCQLGVIPNTEIYVDMETHKRAEEIETMKIFQYTGAINFASATSFKRYLYKHISITPKTIRKASLQLVEAEKLIATRTLIIDLAHVTHLDIAGSKTLIEIQKEMELFNAKVILTSPNDRVFDAIKHAEVLSVGKFQVMASIHDAVIYAKMTHNESA